MTYLMHFIYVCQAAGIPDFRSQSSGLYANLKQYDLPYPEAIFELSYFKVQFNFNIISCEYINDILIIVNGERTLFVQKQNGSIAIQSIKKCIYNLHLTLITL